MSAFITFLADASGIIANSAKDACADACNTNTTAATLFRNAANTMVFLIGSLSVIMIIFGGIRYVISRGDPKNIEAAKQTIIYAVGGVIVAIVSFAIIKFVTTNIK